MKASQFRLAEVESFPQPLEAGVLYYSERFSGAAHACACGCGMEVITPISPVQWRITRNARGVSLRPSIGNWNFPCRSHYWIIDSRVHWSGEMTDEQIRKGRQRDLALRNAYYKAKQAESANQEPQQTPVPMPRPGFIRRIVNWMGSFLR